MIGAFKIFIGALEIQPAYYSKAQKIQDPSDHRIDGCDLFAHWDLSHID